VLIFSAPWWRANEFAIKLMTANLKWVNFIDMMPILGAPILIASVSGDDSRHIENMTDVAIVSEIMGVLFLSFPNAPNPTSFGVTVCGINQARADDCAFYLT
jgi:hypothetical protein